jgi:anaerobic ribonucleoside-triphosphate reductase
MTKKEIKDLSAKRQPCEVYSRSIGYIRPVSKWNVSKKQEFKDRNLYQVKSVTEAS